MTSHTTKQHTAIHKQDDTILLKITFKYHNTFHRKRTNEKSFEYQLQSDAPIQFCNHPDTQNVVKIRICPH